MAMELCAIPGGNATFAVPLAAGQGVILFSAYNVGGRVAITAPWLCVRYRIGHMRYINYMAWRAVVALTVSAATGS